MLLRFDRLLGLAALLTSVVIVMTVGTVVHAQGPDALSHTADLSITAAPDTGFGRPWTVSVKATPIGGHPLAAVRNVKVRFSAETVSPGVRFLDISPVVTIENAEEHGYSDGASMWTIFSLPLDGSAAEAEVVPPTIPGSVQQDKVVLIRVTAEIVESDPAEPPGFQGNNAVEFWYSSRGNLNRSNFNNGDAGVKIDSVSDRSPGVGGTTTFTVRAENYGSSFSPLFRDEYFSNHQLGVQVKIELSPGLTLAGTPSAPSGTNFSATDAAPGIWDIGALEDGYANAKSFPVAVNLTSDSLADLPLEKRCLTAEVTRAVPWFPADLSKRRNDIAAACLGEAPKLLPLTRGDFILFNIKDCVGITSHPCTSADTVEILSEAGFISTRSNERLERELTRGLGYGDSSGFIKPERITVQVRDPAGRHYDSNSNSLTDGDTVTWQTGRTTSGYEADGVRVKRTRRGLNDQIADWSSIVRTVSVSGLDGAAAPGRVRVRFDSSRASIFYDPNPTHERTPFTLSSSTRVFTNFLEFSDLGTYLVEYKVDVTRTDSAVYTGSGTYTFHVGPIAELEVRDGGDSPKVARARRAYTIEAVNNGPDAAPAVRVTGLPVGVTEYIASEGGYDPASGTWNIGKMGAGAGDGYRNSGHAYEGPTLTLITDDPAAPAITAVIENTQPYSVVIDGTTHSTHYYDYMDQNNSATVKARIGTGPRHPDAPGGVTAMETLSANILTWGPVAWVNGFWVTHYEVQRSASSASSWTTLPDVADPMHVDMNLQPEQPAQYRVRAVNVFGVRGPWSQIVRTQGMAGSPGLTLVAPTEPRNVSARVVGTDRAVLSWTPPSIPPDSGQTMQPITGYRVQMSDDGGHWVDPAGLLSGSVTSWTDPNLPPNITRRYRVQAINQIAAGPWSAPTIGIVYNAPIIGDPLPDTGPQSMPPISASRVITSDGDLKLEVWWVGQTWDTQWWTVLEYRERGGPWWYGDEVQGDQSRLPRWEGHQPDIRAGQDYDVRACRLTIDQLNDVRVSRADGDWCRGRGTSTARVSGGSASHRAQDGGVPAFFVDWATRRAGAWTRYTIS